MKDRKLILSHAEFHSLTLTLEGCVEEFEELMKTHEYFTTELVDRLATCLEIIGRAK